VDQVEIVLSAHSVTRFHERLRPGLERSDAEDQLAKLISEHGCLVDQPPEWVTTNRASTVAFVAVGEDVVLPLEWDVGGEGLVALTCLCRGSLSPAARRFRTARRQRRRRFRRLAGEPVYA
jgi:hypothetical protein